MSPAPVGLVVEALMLEVLVWALAPSALLTWCMCRYARRRWSRGERAYLPIIAAALPLLLSALIAVGLLPAMLYAFPRGLVAGAIGATTVWLNWRTIARTLEGNGRQVWPRARRLPDRMR